MPEGKRLAVFFVDDEAELGEIFKEEFSEDRFMIESFTNPIDVLKAVSLKSPDVFFIDYRIPRCNGDELARLLPTSIPKYLLTGELDAKPEYVFEAILSKSFESEKISKILDLHWHRKND